MITFNRIVEVKQQVPGIWYARIVLNKDGKEYESDFIKIRSRDLPGLAKIQPLVEAYLEVRNTPEPESPLIPELPPNLPSLTSEQRSTLATIWVALRDWLRRLIGRR